MSSKTSSEALKGASRHLLVHIPTSASRYDDAKLTNTSLSILVAEVISCNHGSSMVREHLRNKLPLDQCQRREGVHRDV